VYSDRVAIDQARVGRLIAKQFPEWADLRITEIRADGTDNRIYRLGDDMVVRLPRLPRAAEMMSKEQHWLPRLAPLLPLTIPVPLGEGTPDDEFPSPWSVYQWLDGENLVRADVDLTAAAVQLGRFVAALQQIDTTSGPTSSRATPVNPADDAEVRFRIQLLGTEGMLDADLATAVWETAVAAPSWPGPPVWIHGDLYPANLLARHRRLIGVIDFGLLGLGDPACDMLPAWALLTAQTRELFRTEVDVDDATWARGRARAARDRRMHRRLSTHYPIVHRRQRDLAGCGSRQVLRWAWGIGSGCVGRSR
jgi:aminoglycoside phosphotransferase (APT) family kinase protein